MYSKFETVRCSAEVPGVDGSRFWGVEIGVQRRPSAAENSGAGEENTRSSFLPLQTAVLKGLAPGARGACRVLVIFFHLLFTCPPALAQLCSGRLDWGILEFLESICLLGAIGAHDREERGEREMSRHQQQAWWLRGSGCAHHYQRCLMHAK